MNCKRLNVYYLKMRFMLTYLEAARFKISCALSELDGKPKPSHPLASHVHVIRDRQGFQQSILKVGAIKKVILKYFLCVAAAADTYT